MDQINYQIMKINDFKRKINLYVIDSNKYGNNLLYINNSILHVEKVDNK